MSTQTTGIQIVGELLPGFEKILSPDALTFIEQLEKKFGTRRKELLAKRQQRQNEIDQGKLPSFLPETEYIRKGELEDLATSKRSTRSSCRNYWTNGSKDGYQCSQFRCKGVYG